MEGAPTLGQDRPPAWTVVVPVKGGAAAKSRLGPQGAHRAALARAIALDCVTAVLACDVVARVVVVSGDGGVRSDAAALGAVVVAERRPDLLGAVADGLSAAGDGLVAVLLGDLPALQPADLRAALAACAEALAGGAPSVVVPDAEGTGSVLLAGTDAAGLRPAFGPQSALAHTGSGSVRLDLDLPRLRRDVDTASDLAAAVRLGVGPRTSAVLRAARSAGVA